MPRDLIQARADRETITEIETVAERRDITRSEAIRQLLRAGIEEGRDDA